MIQRGGPAAQGGQIVQRVEHVLVAAVAAGMPRYHLSTLDDLNTVDVALDRHRSVGAATRHAVAIAVEMNRLVLVHLRRLADAGIEAVRRQRQSLGLVTGKALTDRLAVTGDGARCLVPTTLMQIGIEYRQVGHTRNRCSPLPLQHANTRLGTWLLVSPRRHAE